MKEYIERAAALNLLGKINPVDFGSMFDYEAHGAVQECLREISYGVEAISAADVAEVRHGRWVRDKWPSGTHKLICSECGEWSGKKSRYCPSCGALMKGDEHEVS